MKRRASVLHVASGCCPVNNEVRNRLCMHDVLPVTFASRFLYGSSHMKELRHRNTLFSWSQDKNQSDGFPLFPSPHFYSHECVFCRCCKWTEELTVINKM